MQSNSYIGYVYTCVHMSSLHCIDTSLALRSPLLLYNIFYTCMQLSNYLHEPQVYIHTIENDT